MSNSLSSTSAVSAKKLTQGFAGVAALTLLAGGGTLFFMNARINADRAKEINLQAQVGSSQDIARRLQTTQAAYDDTRSRIAFLETTVSEKAYVPTLLQQLQALAATTDLAVNSVNPSPIVPAVAPTSGSASGAASGSASASNADGKKKAAAPPYDTMDVDLHVTGTYSNTARFLYGLTHFPKVISVISVQMSPGSSTPQSAAAPQVSTDLKLTAFVFHDDGTADAPIADASEAAPTGAGVVPPPAAPTVAGAAGRAARGAVAATQAANAHGSDAVSSL